MEDPLWSSPPRAAEGGEWKTPPRKTIRVLARQGKSDREIEQETGIPHSTVNRIRRQESSQRMHKKRPNKARMMIAREIRRTLRFIITSYSTRCLSFERVYNILGIKASARTIRRELRRLGYQRYISCPRPFISRAQAKKRLSFA
jgi:transposase